MVTHVFTLHGMEQSEEQAQDAREWGVPFMREWESLMKCYRKIPMFAMGHITATPGVVSDIDEKEAANALFRHATGDWGTLDKHDGSVNAEALVTGGRLLSAYYTLTGRRIWIITEADRSVTTLLLPEEY